MLFDEGCIHCFDEAKINTKDEARRQAWMSPGLELKRLREELERFKEKLEREKMIETVLAGTKGKWTYDSLTDLLIKYLTE
jgi:hypothetical protein